MSETKGHYRLKNLLRLLLLFGGMLIACAPKQTLSDIIIPENIIQPDSIVEIICDLQIAEALLNDMKMKGQQTDSTGIKMFEAIFQKYHTTKETYQTSIRFYENNLLVYDEIYTRVITRLTQKQTELNSTRPEPPE